MNSEELRKELAELLGIDPNSLRDHYARVVEINPNKFQIITGQMYEHPNISFQMLMRLSTLFGTQKIDVDEYESSSGCDTCDYGSNYANSIEIIDPTLHVEELRVLSRIKGDGWNDSGNIAK